MPKSRVRKKKSYAAQSKAGQAQSASDTHDPSPQWVPITAVSLIVFGIGWLVLFYLSGGAFPVAAWGYWNLAVGFSAMVAALLVLSKWK